ncbi:MAG TPA: urease accessory UreF family protein [Chthoniobacterales bacterium]|nr:urease accessory UreF family protein [Chthoniobacterales bacterium]
MPTATGIRKLVGLLHLASPALPIGGFSYSQGLEGAVECRLVHDGETAREWIRNGLEIILAANELPVVAILHRAWERQNYAEIYLHNAWFLASRESLELRLETEQMGWSLAQLAMSLEWHDDNRRTALRDMKPIGLPAAFAFAAGALGIDVESCVTAYCFSWIENQVAAAIKAIPLGQVAGQRILFGMHSIVPNVVLRAINTGPDQVSTFAPQLAIISSRHTTQYSRLFRS